MALLTERCFFIDFPFYHRSFSPDLDFSWDNHAKRLAAFGHDVNISQPLEIQFWKGEDLTLWLMHDQKALYDGHYGILLKNDPDYSAALLQANPFHRAFLHQLFPTGEMFQPLARFLLKVRVRIPLLPPSFSCHFCFLVSTALLHSLAPGSQVKETPTSLAA